jgi:hypothetical protein
MKKLLRTLIFVSVTLIFTTTVLAAGTPSWWDNPGGYSSWKTSSTTGTVTNTGTVAQYVTVIWDVDNDYLDNAYKDVWAQVEWTLVQGTGYFDTTDYSHMIRWANDAANCPSGPAEPFPNPTDVAFMNDEDAFASEWGYDNGRELSYNHIEPQPECERLEFKFWVGPSSQIDYRLEIQTLCFYTANAVVLRDLAASSPGLSVLAGVVGIGGIGLVGMRIVNRRRHQ